MREIGGQGGRGSGVSEDYANLRLRGESLVSNIAEVRYHG
jgi:hypothetical protein